MVYLVYAYSQQVLMKEEEFTCFKYESINIRLYLPTCLAISLNIYTSAQGYNKSL